MRTRSLALSRDFNTLFNTTIDAPRTWIPRVDVFETDGTLAIRAELPGFSADDLDVSLSEGVLTLSGTRTFEEADNTAYLRRELAEGSFSRKIRIAKSYDADSIEASYRDGILTVTLAKRPDVAPRKVDIVAG